MAAMIPDEVIRAVRDASDLVEVASEYLTLIPQGNMFVAHCFRNHGTDDLPHYDTDPSLQFFRDRETGEWRYHCKSCGLGANDDGNRGPADVFKFIQQYYRYTQNQELDFPTVVRILGERAGIEVPPSTPPDPEIERLKNVAHQRSRELWLNLMNDQSALDYLMNERGLDMEDIRNPVYRLGLASPDDPYRNCRNRIAFGVCEVTHNPKTARTVGFQYRLRPGVECGAPDKKFVVDYETKIWKKGEHLYLLHAAVPEIRRRGYVHVVEGNFDAIWMHKVGFTNTVATMGTSLTTEMLTKLGRYTKRIMFWMEDQAGINALQRNLGSMLSHGFEVLVIDTDGKDPDEICRRYGAGVDTYIRNHKQPAVQYLLDAVRARYDAIVNEAKGQALRQIVPILSKMTDPISRSVYLGEVARVYQVAIHELTSAVPTPVVPESPNQPVKLVRVGA